MSGISSPALNKPEIRIVFSPIQEIEGSNNAASTLASNFYHLLPQKQKMTDLPAVLSQPAFDLSKPSSVSLSGTMEETGALFNSFLNTVRTSPFYKTIAPLIDKCSITTLLPTK